MTTQIAVATAAPYLTKYSEEEWLDVLYLAVRNGNDRIEMLKKLAGIRLLRPRADSYDAIRASCTTCGLSHSFEAEESIDAAAQEGR